jgi:hypothetical protein
MKHTYTPSKLLPGEGELLRERAFTNWLSSDLHQAAAHFMINVGLVAIYAECDSAPAVREEILRSSITATSNAAGRC